MMYSQKENQLIKWMTKNEKNTSKLLDRIRLKLQDKSQLSSTIMKQAESKQQVTKCLELNVNSFQSNKHTGTNIFMQLKQVLWEV